MTLQTVACLPNTCQSNIIVGIIARLNVSPLALMHLFAEESVMHTMYLHLNIVYERSLYLLISKFIPEVLLLL